jgi:hypothetical protein
MAPEEARAELERAFALQPVARRQVSYRPLWIMAAIVVFGLVVIVALLTLRSMHVL